MRYPALKFISKTIPESVSAATARKIHVPIGSYTVTTVSSLKSPPPTVAAETKLTTAQFVASFYGEKPLVLKTLRDCLDDETVLTQRAAFDFLISHLPLSSSAVLTQHEKILLVESCCYQLLRKNDSLIRRFYSWVLGEPGFGDTSGKHCDGVGSESLRMLSSALLSSMKRSPAGEKEALAPVQILKIIYYDNETIGNLLLPELTIPILAYLDKYKEGQDFSKELIRFSADFLSSDAQSLLMWQALGKRLSELSQGTDNAKTQETVRLVKFFFGAFVPARDALLAKQEYLTAVLSKALTSVGSVSEGCTRLENATPGLALVQDIIQAAGRVKLTFREKGDDELVSGVRSFLGFYKQLASAMISGGLVARPETVEEAFGEATQVAVKLQLYMGGLADLEWLQKLVSCILAPKMSSGVAQIGIEGILQIWETAAQGTEAYKTLERSFADKDCAIVSVLWNMLGVSTRDRNLTEQIIRAECARPAALSACIATQLGESAISSKLGAINRFSLFWKLSAEYFPIYVPVQSENCLLRMVDSLNHDHPLIRHAGKGWLVESMRRLDRVLDPILKSMLAGGVGAKFAIDGKSQQVVYQAEFSGRAVTEGCKRLRTIILANKTDMLAYLVSTQVYDELYNLYAKDEARKLFDTMVHGKSCIHLLVFLALRCIMGTAGPGLGTDFLTENAAVNACGCELLELILTSLGAEQLTPSVVSMVSGPLLNGLQNSFRSKDTAMQVETLKLVRILQTRIPLDSRDCVLAVSALFASNAFSGVLKKGVGSTDSYVRSCYIGYVASSMPVLVTFLGESFDVTLSVLFTTLCSDLASCSAVPSIRCNEVGLISSQTDIMQVLSGVKEIINFCFTRLDEELEKPAVAHCHRVLGYFTARKPHDCAEEMRKAILNSMGGLVASCNRLWKTRDQRRSRRDHKFSSRGVLPIDGEGPQSFSLAETETSLYQREALAVVQPLMAKHSSKFTRQPYRRGNPAERRPRVGPGMSRGARRRAEENRIQTRTTRT